MLEDFLKFGDRAAGYLTAPVRLFSFISGTVGFVCLLFPG
jgi:hypothetical protein